HLGVVHVVQIGRAYPARQRANQHLPGPGNRIIDRPGLDSSLPQYRSAHDALSPQRRLIRRTAARLVTDPNGGGPSGSWPPHIQVGAWARWSSAVVATSSGSARAPWYPPLAASAR